MFDGIFNTSKVILHLQVTIYHIHTDTLLKSNPQPVMNVTNTAENIMKKLRFITIYSTKPTEYK